MVPEVHLVQGLEGQGAPEAPIEEWPARKDPPQLLEVFIYRPLEHRLVRHRIRARHAPVQRLHVGQMAFNEINVDLSCLETWVR